MIYQVCRVAFLAQWISLCFLCAMGQLPKRSLHPSDYSRWEGLGQAQVSSDAGYVVYPLKAVAGGTRHVVRALANEYTQTYTNVRSVQFLDFNKRLVYLNSGDTLLVESFGGKRLLEVPHVASFQSLAEGRFLVLSNQNLQAQEPKEIRLLDMKDFTSKSIAGVVSVSVAPDQRKIACAIGGKAKAVFKVFDPFQDRLTQSEIPQGHGANRITWSADARSLVFFVKKDGEVRVTDSVAIMLDVTKESSFSIVDLSKMKGWSQLTVATYGQNSPLISADKKRLFITANLSIEEDNEPEHVEIWKSRAKWLYPYRKAGDTRTQPKLGFVNLDDQTFTMVTDPLASESILGLAERYVLSFDRHKYLPEYKFGDSYFDIRLSDLSRMEDHVIDTFVRDYGRRFLFAESLGSLVYYADSHWNLYDLSTRKKIKVTQHIPNLITECVNCNQGLAIGKHDRNFYVFDQLDLWQVDTSGSQVKKLTGHDGEGIEFRFASSVYGYGKANQVLEVDPVHGIYLQAFNRKTGDTGYFKWTLSKGLEQVVYGAMKYTALQVLPQNKGYLYTREAFDRSPELIWQPAIKAVGRLVASSNDQQMEYHWGRSEMVHYRSSRGYRSSGRALNGALFYPANYDPSKKYPLIVSIYEDNTYTLHEYQNPGVNRFIDFNPTDYTLDGYFVLHPNLRPREVGNPGNSMMENLQAAVDYMKSTGMIDETKIGLYGHSFGGYEALFAASQTDDFATIIAGASIADVVTDYFSHRRLLRGPSFYRTEQMQKGMKRSYFEIPELYEANSPFRYIPNIKTPLLLWTGKNDNNVGAEQSVQFYLGMLRMDKECTLLMYPDEDHVLAKPENLQDLDRRMKQWFGHYLKAEARQEWMMGDQITARNAVDRGKGL